MSCSAFLFLHKLPPVFQQITDYMLEKQPKTKKDVRKIMGRKLLKLHSEIMIKKGKREGRKEGEGCLALLMSLLLKSGKAEEAAAASESEQFREELYKNDGQLRFFPRMPHATWLIADIESIKVNLC